MNYQPSPHQYSQTIGVQLLNALTRSGIDLFTTAQASSNAAALGLSASHTRKLLHQLTMAGWITRIKNGLYAVNSPATKLPEAHPYAIATSIVTPSAISHWTALQHWGLTEQIPNVVMVSSPKRTFPHRRNVASSGQRARWVVAGMSYEFTTIPHSRFFGVSEVWVSERDRVPIFDRERTVLDMFHHFHIFGSLSFALHVLDEHLDELDIDRLIRYALQIRTAAVIKRLGWTLDMHGVPLATLELLLAYPSKEEAPLDPGLPSRGPHDRRWRIIDNLQAHA